MYFNRLLAVFKANDIKIIFVVDGARNPLKTMTNETRKKKSSDATKELFELTDTGDYYNCKKITALKKKAVYVRGCRSGFCSMVRSK